MSEIITIKSNADEVKLIPLGDIHLGYKTFNLSKLLGTIEYIKNAKDCYVLGLGDYCELANKNSPGASMWDQNKQPIGQFKEIIEILQPIRKKIIGLLDGNHEGRTKREIGIPMSYHLATNENMRVPYLGNSVFINFIVGKQSYIVYATHGNTGSTTAGGKINALLNLGKKAEADLILTGHVHDIITIKTGRLAPDAEGKNVVMRKQYYTTTGHFLDYEGSYGDEKNYPPTIPGVVKIKFFKKKWDLHIST